MATRILHIFGSLDRGGAEMRTLELMKFLHGSGILFDFCCLSGSAGTLAPEVEALGGRVFPEKLGFTFPGRFRRLLRRGHYDVIHSHVFSFSGYLLKLAHQEGVRIRIAHFRNMSGGATSSFLQNIRRRYFLRLIDQHATAILAVSRGAMEYGWSPGWAADPRAHVVYNGVDTSPFGTPVDVASTRHALGLSEQAIVYIHVGRFDPPKNHLRLLAIFARILERDPAARLLLVGRGGNAIEQEVHRLVRKLHLEDRVLLAGERDDVPQLLAASDVMLFPSLWEGLPGVVLEACAAGVPVVASDVPGTREIAGFLPGLVHTLSLDSDDSAWADRAISLAQKPRLSRAGATPLDGTPFRLDRSAREFARHWGAQP